MGLGQDSRTLRMQGLRQGQFGQCDPRVQRSVQRLKGSRMVRNRLF